MELYYDEITSPVGTLTIIFDSKTIVRIEYGAFADMESKMAKWSERYFDNPVFVPIPGKANYVKDELHEYFQGSRQEFSFDFVFHGTIFQQKVWQALYETLSYGQTKTYKDIAVTIGNPKAVRAVGGAVNKNPLSILVPCHRVIGANGKMVGYNGGLDKKEFLLELEAK